jgi:hypothetical protein
MEAGASFHADKRGQSGVDVEDNGKKSRAVCRRCYSLGLILVYAAKKKNVFDD